MRYREESRLFYCCQALSKVHLHIWAFIHSSNEKLRERCGQCNVTPFYLTIFCIIYLSFSVYNSRGQLNRTFFKVNKVLQQVCQFKIIYLSIWFQIQKNQNFIKMVIKISKLRIFVKTLHCISISPMTFEIAGWVGKHARHISKVIQPWKTIFSNKSLFCSLFQVSWCLSILWTPICFIRRK